MSFSQPSQVSATTGKPQACAVLPAFFNCQAITASRATPTLCVLVMTTGLSRKPDSSIQVVPVISPLPLSEYQPAKTGSDDCLPRGKIAVTPVRTGPPPTSSLPSPEINVVGPTSTPLTSVIALNCPGVPSKGTPKSRARGFVCIGCEFEVLVSDVSVNSKINTRQPELTAKIRSVGVLCIPSPFW